MTRDLTSSKPQSSGWHVALDAASQECYLGNPQIVWDIIAMFNKGIVDRRPLSSDEADYKLALVADKAECYRMADIFLGRVEGYTPIGAWSTEGHIADHAASIMGLEPIDDKRETLAASFGAHVLAMYRAIDSARSGEPDEVWEAAVMSANYALRAALLGLPDPNVD